MNALELANPVLFLSTLSLRRATFSLFWLVYIFRDFYPRSPCGERRTHNGERRPNNRISIHALLAESDGTLITRSLARVYFYPRSPCGERLIGGEVLIGFTDISIHALLAESDQTNSALLSHATMYFYPRSPCGERPKTGRWGTGHCRFLSTLSLRRATTAAAIATVVRANFYPRSPCGERRWKDAESRAQDSISIHALLAESDPAF